MIHLKKCHFTGSRLKSLFGFLLMVTLFLPLLVGGKPVWSQDQAAPDSSWSVRCQEEDSGNCEIFQRLILQETGVRVAEFAVGFPQNKKTARGVVVLPLGILLPHGVQMQIDEHQPFKFQVRFCTKTGCFAYLSLNEQVLEMMRMGGQAMIKFKTMQGQEIEIPISLMGFTKALKEIS